MNVTTLESKEKFRRFLLIFSRVIAILLICGIFFIGFVQIKYSKQVNDLKNEYGPNAYCYLCGYETGKVCSCNYVPDLISSSPEFNPKDYFENIATLNAEVCENRNNQNKELNFTL